MPTDQAHISIDGQPSTQLYPVEVISYEPQLTSGMHWCPSVSCPNCHQLGQHQYQHDGKHYANYCVECEITWIYRGKEEHHDSK